MRRSLAVLFPPAVSTAAIVPVAVLCLAILGAAILGLAILVAAATPANAQGDAVADAVAEVSEAVAEAGEELAAATEEVAELAETPADETSAAEGPAVEGAAAEESAAEASAETADQATEAEPEPASEPTSAEASEADEPSAAAEDSAVEETAADEPDSEDAVSKDAATEDAAADGADGEAGDEPTEEAVDWVGLAERAPAFVSVLHPALVHFPIALWLLGALFVVLGVFAKSWRTQVPLACLIVGTLGSVASTLSGWWWADELGYEGWRETDWDLLIVQHRWYGVALVASSVVLSFIALVSQAKRSVFLAGLWRVGLLALAAGVAWEGHLGGEMLHGEGFVSDAYQEWVAPEE